MILDPSGAASRFRIVFTRLGQRFGFREDSFLMVLAVLIGAITAVAAVGFHELINFVRDRLYLGIGEERLYGPGIWLLIAFPALGGLAVGIISRYVFRAREGHGIVDVMESVVRTSGFQRPSTAIEKIITSGVTIGSGGSAGAEGPIVQIGAAIASGVGQLFRIARQQMPVLIGCGSAAGISAIFNAPFGGVLFTLEVILQDFSIRAFTPVVVASVIAQTTELLLFKSLNHAGEFHPIFAVSPESIHLHESLQWGQVGCFVLLGVVCGWLGIALTNLMHKTESMFALLKTPRHFRPALGGAILGVMGVIYIIVFAHLMMHNNKPVPFDTYPMPAFFGDGYGFIETLFDTKFAAYLPGAGKMLILLAFLCGIKIVATCLTLGSGGSGGVIAPCLFIGATAGAVVGVLMQKTHLFPGIQPDMFALVGMGAVLAAVVHAPLASILIVFEVTEDYKIMVPAMLACIVATAISRLMHPDSIYTASLRERGIRVGDAADFTLLRRMNVEQVTMEPASLLRFDEPFQKLLDLASATGASNFIVTDKDGNYTGMVTGENIQQALIDHDAIPLLVVNELARDDLPMVKNTDDLGTVLNAFSRYDVSHLPVVVANRPKQVIGLISRSALMRRYQNELDQRA